MADARREAEEREYQARLPQPEDYRPRYRNLRDQQARLRC